jgi:hypothetical protein
MPPPRGAEIVEDWNPISIPMTLMMDDVLVKTAGSVVGGGVKVRRGGGESRA